MTSPSNLEKLLTELETGMEGLNLPWHIGHVDENSDAMDVEDCHGWMVAENSQVPNFICKAPIRLKLLIEIIKVQQAALNHVHGSQATSDCKLCADEIGDYEMVKHDSKIAGQALAQVERLAGGGE